MALTDFFVPEELEHKDDLEGRRARLAVKIVYLLVPWSLGSAAFGYWLSGGEGDPTLSIIWPLFLVAAPFVLRASGRLRLASHFILVPIFFVMSLWALMTGGVTAPGISWLLLVPLLAIVFQGMKTAGIWLGIVVVTWLGMFGVDLMGYTIDPGVATDQYQFRRTIELGGLGVIVFGLFYLKNDLQGWLVENLRRQEAGTRAVVETAPDGIVTTDLEGTVLESNAAAAEVFGTTRDELIGASIETLVESLDWEAPSSHLDGETGEEHRARDGEQLVPVEISFGLMELEERENRLVLVLRDITERKEARRQLREARDRAQEANRAKSTFLANMSHELRTPLNAVIGYSEMLLEEIDALEESDAPRAHVIGSFAPDLERVRSAGDHLLSLINDILDLSKIEAQDIEVSPERFEVRELSEDIAGTIRPLAAQNDNEFAVELADDLEVMYSDPTKVRQILFNLLSNACKFTDNGTVHFEARRDRERGEYVFTVTDTGIGMTDQQLQDVFEAFQQADSSTTREFGGTGLGLTLTRHFCELLGGEIDVASTRGEGTTFTVTLPERAAFEEGDASPEDDEESNR